MKTQHQLQHLTEILGESLVLNTMNKLAQIEGAKCLRRIERLQDELGQYETRFTMKSEEAWEQYQAGRLGDDFDVMEWMGLFENLKALQAYYIRLTNIQLS
jgi:hypothetical protein